MECKTKEMSSYQKLKYEMDKLYRDYIQEKTKAQIYNTALWKIANLKGAELVQGPGIALTALFKTNETK